MLLDTVKKARKIGQRSSLERYTPDQRRWRWR